ncbi:hypothetical protein [Marinagarivorans cellulosilyticus]|uniref:Uncharacterized protein n=1 Tax=Marinagarivorans cellulosilyticus TaxID=2721545 RepID=A0AAN2BIT9_9GAMM|nr:hypothetical protein [Marinagarivorans cellulosilyticus]BCD96226.1 hypothetical protein MARGE09_P0425 [Marinagarivorans cellulosilyticus]
MKCFIIQIDPSRDTRYSIEAFTKLVREQGKFPEVEADYDNNTLTNLNFFTEQPGPFWQEMQSEILQHPDCASWIKRVAIVACEGEHGWNDALLLAHYDSSETLDSLDTAPE